MPGDEQDAAERVDADELDPDDFPADRPLGLPDTLAGDITSAGDVAEDSVAEREWREEPDVIVGGEDVADELPGRLIDPDDPFGPDETKELVGEAGERDDEVVDELPLSEGTGYGRGSDRWPAEEAALHIEGEPEELTISEIVGENES